MSTNSVSNNGKKPVQNNNRGNSVQQTGSYILRNTDNELQLGLNGNNKNLWEVPAFESSNSLFETKETKSVQKTQNPQEILGMKKGSITENNPIAFDKKAETKEQIAEVIRDDDDRGDSKYSPEQISNIIVETSEKYGVDPLVVASIAKQETHFTQEQSGKNGKGMMQLTTISLKDMYLRSDIYGNEIKPLLDKYGSYDKLLKAVKSNITVNIEVGTALFRRKLKDAKGNLTKALQNYNGSSLKVAYAKSVQKHYKAMKN